MDKKILGVLLILVVVAAGLSYQFTTTMYQGELTEKQTKISLLEQSIQEARAELEASEQPPISDESIGATDEDVNCLLCHELGQTKSFHVPQTIMQINERDGKRRRVCVDCHGELGPPWSADKQLTPLSEINFNSEVGRNGVFELKSKIAHAIHKTKLDSGAVTCQECHGDDIEMIIPQPDTGKGHVLVCQNCKFHPENGNYITIHLELAGKKCTVCHTGGIIRVHQDKTKKLGQV
jgi:nitrate reductase cytochrome c-type subunit